MLMRLALTDLFKAHWSDHIHEEWINSLLKQRKFTRDKLNRVRELMDSHAKDAKVTGYEPLIDNLELPDPNDRHVLAAAIRCGANAIITFNLKDFPKSVLTQFGIDALHPDDFIYCHVDIAPSVCCSAIKKQRLALKNPEVSVDNFLASLQKQQLPQTISKLKEFSDFL